ncbi:MAG: DedA family protein [Sedimentisphaerales bacterium]|nr:DedA family protein [Sedimentisphaerales bacterium]
MAKVERMVEQNLEKELSGQTSDEGRATSHAKVAWWHWHRHLYNWVVHWADTRYGMLALILLAITEPICVPIPADVMVIGMSLGKPKRAIWYGLICSFFSVLGGTIAFSLGLAIGPERVIAFFEYISFVPIDLGQKAQQALELYQKYDFWAISISALTPVPYMLFSWLGGMAEVSLLKFVIVSLIFRPMRFGSEGVLFYFLGERARRIIEKYFNTATVVVIILLAIVAYALKKLGQIF